MNERTTLAREVSKLSVIIIIIIIIILISLCWHGCWIFFFLLKRKLYHLNLIQIHFSPLILLLFNWILYISNLFNSGILSNFVLKNALKNFYFLLEEIYKINNIFFFKKSFFISYVGAKTWAFALGLSPTL